MAIKQEIIDYIRNGVHSGHAHDALVNELSKVGWHHNDITDSVHHMNATSGNHNASSQLPHSQTPSAAAHTNLGLFGKLKMALFRPGELFTAIKGEEGYGSSFKYYMIFSIFLVINYILTQPTGTFAFFSLLTPEYMTILLLAIVYVLGLPLIFINVIIPHIGVIIFGGRGGYHQTFKAVTYGVTSPHVIGIIPVLILYLSSSMGLFPDSISDYMTWVYMGVFMIFALWGFYITARGLSKLHDVSFLRAIIMLMIIPLILMIMSVAGSLLTYNTLTSYMSGMVTGEIEVMDSFCMGDNTATIIVANNGESAISVADIIVTDVESGSTALGSWKETNNDGVTPNREITTIPSGKTGMWSGTCSEPECAYRLIYKSGRAQTVRTYC